MIKEAYCSFEVSQLLKEKGFNSPCIGRYSIRSKEFHLDCTKMCNNGGLFECAAPTHQMAMAWLREKGFHIYTFYIKLWNFEIQNLNEDWTYSKTGYKSHEEAIEAALKYTLENLI